jgi:predicted Zn-dependent protease
LKALEIEPTSVVTKRSLAEMKRASGKPNEAETLYRELLATNADDVSAQAGLILSLFDGEKQTVAEGELAKYIEKNPNDFYLAASVGYWYAAHNNSEKAIEFASRAVSLEPRFVWGQIALARGLQKRPSEAEQSLLVARQYGNFPTLIYELATARVQAGFYEEAVNELKTGFRQRVRFRQNSAIEFRTKLKLLSNYYRLNDGSEFCNHWRRTVRKTPNG